MMGMKIQNLMYTLPAIIIVMTIHEYSHAKVADVLGDPTPRNSGRLTLNPLAHIDPLGLLMLVLVRLGWAKPVPTSPIYYKDRKRGILYVSLAGPLSGVLLAFVVSLILASGVWGRLGLSAAYFLKVLYSYSLTIAVFNLIPVYPLDGSRILQALLPPNTAVRLQQYHGQMQIIFLLVIFFGSRFLWMVLDPVIMLLDFIIGNITGVFY